MYATVPAPILGSKNIDAAADAVENKGTNGFMQSKPIRVLLVDGNLTLLWGLGKLIKGESPRMTLVSSASTVAEALVYARLHPSVTLLDLELDARSSVEFIPEIKRRSGGNVLIYTGLGDRRLHEDAMLFGALGVVRKDDSADALLQAIEAAHQGKFWNLDPSALFAQRLADTPSNTHAELGIAFLSPTERRTIARCAARWHAARKLRPEPPMPIGELVSIYNKLGVRNRAELASFAVRHGLTDQDS
jgi:two-component system, NarL family, nitrate/nitrite response regulator NarL